MGPQKAKHCLNGARDLARGGVSSGVTRPSADGAPRADSVTVELLVWGNGGFLKATVYAGRHKKDPTLYCALKATSPVASG